ncbi:hypothetical protein CA984_01660 [Streptosporangium minutum]|uniref:Uncharacterized protein n=1 Tax=Streptosporangium minutum TaxID=569862 RepID=A0A243RZ23_9ACTN|nr:hypothetical protein CA984_01660 [Streptosporangium minutum]
MVGVGHGQRPAPSRPGLGLPGRADRAPRPAPRRAVGAAAGATGRDRRPRVVAARRPAAAQENGSAPGTPFGSAHIGRPRRRTVPETCPRTTGTQVPRTGKRPVNDVHQPIRHPQARTRRRGDRHARTAHGLRRG